MKKTILAIYIGIIVFIAVVISIVFIGIQNQQATLDEQMRVFESRLPKTILVQTAIESGWSNDYHIKDEQVFLLTIKLYEITEVWRTRYGSLCKYSFVHDSVVYYYFIGES